MNKVFLYLYPIKEFTEFFLKFHNENSLEVLNRTINKRYRSNGYQIIYVLFKDKELYGLKKYPEDKIILTDTTFNQLSSYDKNGQEKKNFTPIYPNEEYIFSQIGNIDEIVIGGYHAMDCCKRVGEFFYNRNIPTLVDLELTDLFFNLYKEDYFDESNYDLKKFKETIISQTNIGPFGEQIFFKMYNSPVYGFYKQDNNLTLKKRGTLY